MAQGLAPSTHRTYKSAQLRFVIFCSQARRLYPSDSPCPANEWTLCLFATHLSSLLCLASIKIYKLFIRHQSVPCILTLVFLTHSWTTCSCNASCVGSSGLKDQSPGSSCLPIADYHMLVIYQSLSFINVPRSRDVLGCFHSCLFCFPPLLRIYSFILIGVQPPHPPVSQ